MTKNGYERERGGERKRKTETDGNRLGERHIVTERERERERESERERERECL